jgi:hypothetical protein
MQVAAQFSTKKAMVSLYQMMMEIRLTSHDKMGIVKNKQELGGYICMTWLGDEK